MGFYTNNLKKKTVSFFLSGYRGKKDVPSLLQSYDKNDLKLDEFVTHRMALSKINDAFTLLKQTKR